MLQQELSTSMERLILSILVLSGSFLIITVAMLTNTPHFGEILPVAATLMGGMSAYWFAGQTAQASAKAADATAKLADATAKADKGLSPPYQQPSQESSK